MMYKNVFRNINFISYLLIGLLATIFQTTIMQRWIFNWLHPDIAFIMAVYFGYRKDPLEGGLLTIIIALIIQTASTGQSYFYLTIYVYTFVFAKILSRIYVIKSLLNATSIVASLFIVKQAGLLVLFAFEGKFQNALPNIGIHLVPSLVTQMILTPILFSLFHELDLKTFSDLHSEDEYDLNKEL